MGLLKKIFKKDRGPGDDAPESSQFHESETTTDQGSRNAPRRELVQVVLRDTMRKHGIPSDWIECQILSVVSRSRATGLHVMFVIRQGEESLLGYVHAFQESFMRELEKYEPRAGDWILSQSWQFTGSHKPQPMPAPGAWRGAGPAGAPVEVAGIMDDGRSDDEVEDDLKALFAIRDAAMRGETPPEPAEGGDFEPTRPGFEESGPRRGRR